MLDESIFRLHIFQWKMKVQKLNLTVVASSRTLHFSRAGAASWPQRSSLDESRSDNLHHKSWRPVLATGCLCRLLDSCDLIRQSAAARLRGRVSPNVRVLKFGSQASSGVSAAEGPVASCVRRPRGPRQALGPRDVGWNKFEKALVLLVLMSRRAVLRCRMFFFNYKYSSATAFFHSSFNERKKYEYMISVNI
jgi:hypothetical protein